jgi:hypothetical protein
VRIVRAEGLAMGDEPRARALAAANEAIAVHTAVGVPATDVAFAV